MLYFKNISNVEILDDLGICADVEYKDGQYLAFCDEDGNITLFDPDDMPYVDGAEIDISDEARNELAEFFAREKGVFALKKIDKITNRYEERGDAYYRDLFDKFSNAMMTNGVECLTN